MNSMFISLNDDKNSHINLNMVLMVRSSSGTGYNPINAIEVDVGHKVVLTYTTLNQRDDDMNRILGKMVIST